jgi:putative protease
VNDLPKMELLAPAGDFACLRAALEAGADAVYLGLTSLNARRRARNFSAAELAQACELAHGLGRRVYLTLNIDLAQAELAEAAKVLEIARRCRVDAVLVRDAAVLALRPHFPELEFHFSTQACIASSADVEAARELGFKRVVLARELTLQEIALASKVGVETEVFAQGALCFSVSGRCLLASWVGGRSGNRGQCTSPCRVPWTVDGKPAGTPLSMHDLSVATRVVELRSAGVRALKIEGRLKTPAWVRAAVSLYRKAIDGTATGEELANDAEALGAYTGRQLTAGYLDGAREGLTGVSGRERAGGAIPELEPERSGGYALVIEVGKRIVCRWSWGEAKVEFDFSRAEIRRAEKAVSVGGLLEGLAAQSVDGVSAASLESNDRAALLVPRTANALEQRVQAEIRRALKARRQLDAPVRPEVAEVLQNPGPAPSKLKEARADRVRLSADQVAAFLSEHKASGGVLVEGLAAPRLEALALTWPKQTFIAALPMVLLEEERAHVEALLSTCARLGLSAEVNGWGEWLLAKRAGVRIVGGPGMGVLNALAARELGRLGFAEVTASLEADQEQLVALLKSCPIPCSIVAFGRPALMTTRVAMPPEHTSGVLEDRRDVRLRAHRESGLWQLRPLKPFDWRGKRLPPGAAHLVIDLVGSDDPVGDWESGTNESEGFNLERKLT